VPEVIEIIGFAAACFTTVAFLPQVIKAHNSRHTKDLSLVMFVLFSIGLILWIIYGINLNSVPVIVANSVTLLLSLYLIYLKVKYG
jgi:MtN3 and saliva related transmembrane protein